ncbi:hypothetical protein FORC085_913 [Bacillus cereus]|nr:hypothetical protein FORC085_913 [Bacillus cereus]
MMRYQNEGRTQFWRWNRVAIENTYHTFIEYKEYPNTFPEELLGIWLKKGICILKRDRIIFKVTGLLIYKNTFFIIFPKSYELPALDLDEKKHIEVLVKTLLKYRNEAVLDPLESELLDGEKGQHKGNLITVYHLIQDFLQNGYLIQKMCVKAANQTGVIDWASTINKKQPVFSGSSIIYIDPVYKKTIVDEQNLLLKLHRFCVYQGIKNYGWLLGISSGFVEPEEDILSNYDLDFILSFLNKELNNTFVERETNVITLLIQYFSGINPENPEENIETLATPYFQNVWETMCSVNFNNQYHLLKQMIPKLKWEIGSNAPVKSQRPDLMIIREKTLYILDAKYYNIEKNLPGWGDIVKQLFYAYTIYTNIQSKKNLMPHLKLDNITRTYNAFLFPSSELEAIKYEGKVEVEGNDQLGDVKAFKVNTFLMMKCYIGIEKFSYINNFIKVSKEIT